MPNKGRKALAMSELMLMILFVAVLLVFLVFNTKLGEIFKGKTPHDICKNSVLANAGANFLLGQFANSITCPTEDIRITEKEDDKIKQKLADELASCWDAFGEGKLQLFGMQGVFCIICDRITFSKQGKLGHMTEWLAAHRLPNGKLTYADYLLGYETEKVHELTADASRFNINDPRLENQIDMTQTYADGIVYVRGEGAIVQFFGDASKSDLVIGGGVIGGASGALIAGLLVGSPVGWIAGAIWAVTTIAGAATGAWTLDQLIEKPQHLAITFLAPYTKDTIQKLGCQYAPATSG
ncbi:hypothetical protein HY642_00905 [Candidatus Woesearchaeota archaeon]|nr:hypothetical protein [Candidatus Woesearchaeota archaeon]